jgi:hypothetical protein
MKEIDFLPEWYRSGRRRRISYRTQYIALGGVFVVMMAWNFMSARSLSRATAELAQMAPRQAQSHNLSREFTEVQSDLARLQEKASLIERIGSKIDVASVLGEMSFLIGEKIVLNKVEFVAEVFAEEPKQTATGSSAVRVASRGVGGTQAPLPDKVRFKVVVTGLASHPSDVAELIRGLENSPYFCLVYPSFSRNKEISPPGGLATGSSIQRTGTSGRVEARGGLPTKKYQVTEFEISWYLANYRQEESQFAGQVNEENEGR